MTNRHLIAAAFLCVLPFGLSGAAPLGDPPQKTDPPAPDSADVKKRKAEQEELKARDLKKLQGKWVVVREVIAGTLQEGDRGHRIFKDNTLRVNRVTEGAFTIDTSVRPKCLTLTYTDEKQRKRTVAYIYSFDDDHLLLGGRFPHFNEDRPLPDFAYAATFLRLERAKE
ncbi:unnamed protein product [Gemmata massiliana]|uniref:TIGR03067 domain-containing protein n=1 Tax=Gemmata massiliana TaxID=1210884 RepID=A0A6P2D737_9BACT|nr:TIGR03067 domain-containing protein [Gemmata massiliana]VTR96737.1 unnamed protein product [Gemmata massiliana]